MLELEEHLTNIRCGVPGVDHVRGEDDFFALGGRSVAAIHLISRVAAETAAAVQVPNLFEEPAFAPFSARAWPPVR